MLNAVAHNSEGPLVAKTFQNHVFLKDVLNGLSKQQKSLSPKYFYDELGSQYFDEICELDEYYPYRSEWSMLSKVANDLNPIFQSLNASHPIHIVEFGAGSLKKIVPLLESLPVSEFVPIDISEAFLTSSCNRLQRQFPGIDVVPLAADFCQPVPLDIPDSRHKLGFFPGSTIGNFAPEDAKQFLKNMNLSLGPGAYLLIGVDVKKSPSILHAAYNDSKQVTAKFNLNVLNRINAELEGDFDLTQFEHYACYNTAKGRVEMHLVSKQKQRVCVSDVTFHFDKGESIHTESSYKYNPDEFSELAFSAGWATEKSWLSEDELFSMHLMSTMA